MTRVLVAVGSDSPEQWLPEFALALPEAEIFWHEAGKALPGQIDYAVVWAPKPGLMDQLEGLKAVFSLGAGVDHIFASGGGPANIPVVRYVGADLTTRMSEWVVLQCLMHLRQQRAYDGQQAKRQWRSLPQPAAGEVRVGLLGLGVLGRDAAAKLKAIGFQVSGWSRSQKQIDGIACHSGESGLAALLETTDILVSLLPLTPDTRGLVNAAVLAQLPQDGALGGPVYLNAGRGRTQVDADILAALESGLLKAASLDVFETEPLPDDSPMWAAPNLTITPHAAAWSARSDVVRYVARQIRRHQAGGALENVVDPQRGY